jgi:hypothetical protein
MFKLIFVFDSLPNSDLYPNKLRSIHWSRRSKVEKQEREYAYYLGLENKGDWIAPEKAVISYEFYSSTKRIRDLDSLISACKPWQDGLKDSGILIDDDCWHLSIGKAEVILAKYDESRLILEAI